MIVLIISSGSSMKKMRRNKTNNRKEEQKRRQKRRRYSCLSNMKATPDAAALQVRRFIFRLGDSPFPLTVTLNLDRSLEKGHRALCSQTASGY